MKHVNQPNYILIRRNFQSAPSTRHDEMEPSRTAYRVNWGVEKRKWHTSMRFLICATLLVTSSWVLPSPTIVVDSFVRTTFAAVPRTVLSALSSVSPTSSLITVPAKKACHKQEALVVMKTSIWVCLFASPPVRMAMSSRYWVLRSPKPGALIAQIFKDPLSLLTTRVARASCSISSAMIRIGYWPLMASSRTLIRSLALVIFLSTKSSWRMKIRTHQ